jgi:flagellar assembly protein FliH
MTRSSPSAVVRRIAGEVPRAPWPAPRAPEPAATVAPLLPVDPLGAGRGCQPRDLVLADLTAERIAAVEREAHERGLEAGAHEAREAARTRLEATLARLAETIDRVAVLRGDLLRGAERDLVRLAIAMAERIVRREIQTDRDAILTMARAALARLGDTAVATVRLHPGDLDAISPRLEIRTATGPIRLVGDAGIPAGGCFVESDLGSVDATIDAQLRELRAALQDDDEPAAGEEAGSCDDAAGR